MNGIDVIALVVLGLGTVGFGCYLRHVDRVLRDEDHPDHEIAKEAVSETETWQTLDFWFGE